MPYIAGFGLGLVLLAAFVLSGQGLGGSGALMRTVTAVEKTISQEHVDQNVYLAPMGGGDKNPFDNWLIYEVIGVLVGGLLSGVRSGRFRVELNKGKQISAVQRLTFAFIGGSLFGAGARIARGCTSGVALSGGAILALGSWATMFAIFAGAYGLAYFFRKLWI